MKRYEIEARVKLKGVCKKHDSWKLTIPAKGSMKNAFKFSVIFLLFLGTYAATRADSIDDFVYQQIKQRKIPGLSLAVIRDGKVIKASGYGFANLELQTPATKDTIYEIGSISKQFAAEAVVLLVEDGKINLDDSIRNICLQMLLTLGRKLRSEIC